MDKSGLQLQVIHFYRQCIRVAHSKPLEARANFVRLCREEFGKHKDRLTKRDVTSIEYLLRTGKARLKALGQPDVHNVTIMHK